MKRAALTTIPVASLLSSSTSASPSETGSASEDSYVWRDFHREHVEIPTGAQTPSDCQNLAIGDIGSSLVYKGSLSGGNIDYILHDFILSNVFKGRLQNLDCSVTQDGVGSHRAVAEVLTDNTSEIHPNYFEENDHAGASPADGNPIPYVHEQATFEAIKGAISTISSSVSIGLTAGNVLDALNNNKYPPEIQQNVEFSWGYWGEKTEPTNYMHVLWKVPKDEYSEVAFGSSMEATSYSAGAATEFQLSTSGEPLPPSVISDSEETYTAAGIELPSEEVVIETISRDELPKSSVLSQDAKGDVVRYSDQSLQIKDKRGTKTAETAPDSVSLPWETGSK